MNIFSRGLVVAAVFSLAASAAPDMSAQGNIERSAFWGNAQKYLDRQAGYMLRLVDEALDANPPVAGDPIARRLALYNFDAVVHDTINDNRTPMQEFVASRIGKVLADLDRPLTSGVRIYKIYNDGFIVRTPSAIWAHDLNRGRSRGLPVVPDSLMALLADRCEAMFLTHNHGDHVDPFVVKRLTKAGKPVLATNDILPDTKGVWHIREEKPFDTTVKLSSGKKLEVKIFPGHQSELDNNIYVVTSPEGRTVAHTGDQYHQEDMDWIVNIKESIPHPDALMVNCWTNRMPEHVEGFAPGIVITGHENEMGHSIDHRESFWLTFDKMKRLRPGQQYAVMGWGEWITL